MTQVKQASFPEIIVHPSTLAYRELCQLWQSITYSEVAIDYTDLLKQNPSLYHVFNEGPCLTWILDVRTQQFAFVGDNAIRLTGYPKTEFLTQGPGFFNQITHPDDLVKAWQQELQNWQALLTLAPEARRNHPFKNEYRIIKPDGTILHLLRQNSVLQQDAAGNITHILGICSDITLLQTYTHSVDQLQTQTGTYFSVPDITLPQAKPLLSKRELDIVKLMAAGYHSKAIAEKLAISFHTVNTHRQKIIEKTQAKTAGGVVQYAVANGLI